MQKCHLWIESRKRDTKMHFKALKKIHCRSICIGVDVKDIKISNRLHETATIRSLFIISIEDRTYVPPTRKTIKKLFSATIRICCCRCIFFSANCTTRHQSHTLHHKSHFPLCNANWCWQYFWKTCVTTVYQKFYTFHVLL